MNTIRSRHPRAPSRILLFAALVGLLAACSPAGGDLGSAATPLPTPTASVDIPSAEPTGGATNPVATPPPADPSASPTAGTTTIRAYFFLGSFTGNSGLVPVLREIPKTQAVATAAMNALLAGPSDPELSGLPAMYTAVPEGTRLLGLSIANGIATVDLTEEFELGPQGADGTIVGRLAQVVYTLTQFPTIESVKFELDGKPVTVIGAEGIRLDKPMSRADYVKELPAIFLDRPAWGAALRNPARLVGDANVFEATFRVAILDGSGAILVERSVMASCGTGCRGTFEVAIPYTVAKAQWGLLRVYDRSAADGSVENLTEYPVWLTPAS